MFKRNLIANYLGQGLVALMGLAFVPLYIKYLGIEAYGLIGLFTLLSACLTVLDMGMTPTLGREMARFTGGARSLKSIRDVLRSIEWIALGIAIFISGTIYFSSSWIASSWLQVKTLPVNVVVHTVVIMGVVIAFRFVEGIYRSAIIGLQRQVLFNVVNSVLACLRWAGAAGILAWFSNTLEAFFIWQGIVSFVSVVVFASVTNVILPNSDQRAQFSMCAVREVIGFAGGMAGIAILSLILMQIDKVLLSHLLTLSEFGYYTLAATVSGSLFLLVGPIAQAIYPRLCELHAQKKEALVVLEFHKGAQLVSIFSGSAAIVLIFFSESFLLLWTQNTVLAEQVAPLLSILMLGNLLNGLMWIPYQTQLAYGWTSLAVRTNITAVLLIVPAIFWIAPRYGGVGVAWAWVVLNAGYVLIGIHFMYRRILVQEKWHWYRDDILAPLGSALAAMLILKWAWSGSNDPKSQIGLLLLAASIAGSVALLAANKIRGRALMLLKSYRHIF